MHLIAQNDPEKSGIFCVQMGPCALLKMSSGIAWQWQNLPAEFQNQKFRPKKISCSKIPVVKNFDRRKSGPRKKTGPVFWTHSDAGPQGDVHRFRTGRNPGPALYLLRKLKIPVRSLPFLYFEDVDDQDIIMDRDERPHIPPDPDGIQGKPWIRCPDLLHKTVGIGTDLMDLPDNLPGGLHGQFLKVPVCPRGIFHLVGFHLTPYFFIISFSEISIPCRTSCKDSSSPRMASSLSGSSSSASASNRSMTSL